MSQLRHVELADECESIKTNTNYVLAGFMTHWRAGSRACSRLNFCEFFFLFFAKKIEPATWRWASYEALSQLRGIEPATWHWASYVALSQQGSLELWASKEAVSQQGSFELHHIYIYIPMQSQPYNILNLGQNVFFWGRHVPLSWSRNVKSTIRDAFLMLSCSISSSVHPPVSAQSGCFDPLLSLGWGLHHIYHIKLAL